MLGKQAFQLDVPRTLANAETLTLEGAGSSPTEQKVRIVASDDRPLPSPILSKIDMRPQTTPLAESAIVREGRLQVTAYPIDADGRTIGSSLTVNLQAQRLVDAKGTQIEREPASTTVTKPEGYNLEARHAKEPVQLKEAVQPQQPRSASNGLPESGNGSSRREMPEFFGSLRSRNDLPRGNLPAPDLLSNSTRPADAQGAPRRDPPYDVQGTKSPPATGIIDGNRLPSVGEKTTLAKLDVATSVSTYRSGLAYGSAQSAAVPREPPSSPQLQLAPTPDGVDSRVTMNAVVIGRTDVGQLILKADDKLLRIDQPVDLPIGTTLQATLAATASALMPSNAGMADTQTSPLVKLIALLESIDRAGVRPDIPENSDTVRQLPTPDKHLGSRLLALLAAGTDQAKPSMPLSLQAYSDVTSAVKDQIHVMVRDLANTASEPLTDGWKSVALPVGSDQSQAICCFFRDHELDPEDGKSQGKDRRDGSRRAVFDLSLSQLGRCQIDALCQGQRFDLLIRTEEKLRHEDQEYVRSLFHSACEAGELSGDIGFKLGRFFEPPKLSTKARDVQI